MGAAIGRVLLYLAALALVTYVPWISLAGPRFFLST